MGMSTSKAGNKSKWMSRNGQVDQRRSEFTGIPRVFVVTTNIVLVRSTEKGSISEHQNSMQSASFSTQPPMPATSSLLTWKVHAGTAHATLASVSRLRVRRVVSDVHCGLNELCKKHRTKKAVIDERTLQRHLGIVPFAKHSLHHCLHSTTTSTYCHGKLTTPTPPLAALKQATQENLSLIHISEPTRRA